VLAGWLLVARAEAQSVELSPSRHALLERGLPALDGNGLFEADHPATLDHLQPGFGFALAFRSNVESVADGKVESLFAGHVRLGIGLFDRLQLSAGFPLLLVRNEPTGLSSEGLGDGMFAMKARLAGPESGDGATLGAHVVASLPFGATGHYLRDVRGPIRGVLTLGLRQGRIGMLLNAGAGFGRDAAVRGARFADEATGIAALMVALVPNTLDLGIEATGHVPTGDDAAEPWLETRVGLKGVLGREAVLALAAGRGVGESFGVPGWNVLLVWAYQPLSRDPDADGVAVAQDRCPDEPEDRDGYEDLDGCPDPDNDRDGIPDEIDACPELAEDINEHQDEDGCPDAHDDADQDRVYDVMDRCLHAPEDRDGFRDFDGCPDDDDDDDGVPDRSDRCPREREDRDGFEDSDGCLDLDNDGDGVADLEDGCPNEAEDFNGLDDLDGCPDALPDHPAEPTKGGPLAVLKGDRIRILEPIHFKHGSARIVTKSHRVLDAIVGVIHADPSIRRVRVEGHTDTVGSRKHNLRLSSQRALSVVNYLASSGVPRRMLAPKGFGPDDPVASNMTPDGRAANRRVEFIVER